MARECTAILFKYRGRSRVKTAGSHELEDLTIGAADEAYMVADSDGVDGSSGETLFLKLGKL